jgi:hypothetical protein
MDNSTGETWQGMTGSYTLVGSPHGPIRSHSFMRKYFNYMINLTSVPIEPFPRYQPTRH